MHALQRFACCLLIAMAAGCEGVQRAWLVGTGNISRDGQIAPVYVVASHHNNLMGYNQITIHEELPDLNNLSAVRKAVASAESSHRLDAGLGNTVDALTTYLSDSAGMRVRCIVLSYRPPVFGYYASQGVPGEVPYIGPFASDAKLDQPLLGYVVGDQAIFKANHNPEKPEKMSAHIVRTVELPEKRTVRELLQTADWRTEHVHPSAR